MNALVVILLGWLMFGLETGLKDTLGVRWGGVAAAPSFVIPLAIFIALCAPPVPALWTCLALGLLLDLTAPQPTSTGLLTIVGPNALGLLLAGQFVLLVRAMVIRRHPVTLMVLSVLGATIAAIVGTALLTARGMLGDPIIFQPTDHLLSGMLSALLTGATAILLSAVFLPLSPLLGQNAGPVRLARR